MIEPDDDSRAMEYRGDFHFALTGDEEVLVISEEFALNLGKVDLACERMRRFLEAVDQSRWRPLSEHLYGSSEGAGGPRSD
jgi:hypothetical protein